MNSALSSQQQLYPLRACYFFFFAILGVIVPYLGIFFQHKGFDPQDIGLLLAIVMGTRIIAPNMWARVADKTGLRAELIKFGAAAAAVSYISFFFHGGFWYFALSLAIYTFFWNAILAQLEVITLETLGDESARYGSIRSWGSIGFIVTVVSAGFAINEWGAGIFPFIGMILFVGLFVCSLSIKGRNTATGLKLVKPLKINAPIIWFLLSALLLQMSAGPFYGFFVIYLKQAGFSAFTAGLMVALGVVAEIIMFMFAPQLLKRFGVTPLLITSLGFTVIRWLLMAFCVEILLLVGLSQLLHAFTFGLVHAASIQFVHQHFDQYHQSQGQALYASISFGVGGALGIWICGYIWGDGSGAMWAWVFAAMCALLSMLAAIFIPANKKTSDGIWKHSVKSLIARD